MTVWLVGVQLYKCSTRDSFAASDTTGDDVITVCRPRDHDVIEIRRFRTRSS